MINDRYKIIRKAGEGRSKVFFCGDILRKGAEFAIKILPVQTNPEELKSFRDEFHLLKKLNHPNIINVFELSTIVSLDKEDKEYDISEGSEFFTLEYFEGCELFDFPGNNNESLLEAIICQISSVLYYLHQSAFIYFDLKSENILVKNINGSPVIKFIDFGLTSRISDLSGQTTKGTVEYIAPEILRKDNIDHRSDLYSFGILIYKIIYGRFPFNQNSGTPDDQLAIYKAHLKGNFDFPECNYSSKIVNLVKRLLSKEIEQRYFTSIGILEELNPERIKIFKKDWTRIPVFAARTDSLSIISTYIEKEDKGEVLIVKGSEGAGKTTLLGELNYKYKDSIFISGEQNSEAYLWRTLLRKILYNAAIYPVLEPSVLQKGKEILKDTGKNFIEELKALFIKLSSANNFIVLIDNFNSLDDFDLEIFLQIIPILQVNKIKIVITEDSNLENSSGRINNRQVINLNPFTESQVAEFIVKSFAVFFPGNEIRKSIIVYSDLLPGSIEIFLKDLIVLNLLEFSQDGPVMNVGVDFDKLLKGSQEEIYQLRLNNLDDECRDFATLLSMFNINPDGHTISDLTGKTKVTLNSLLEKLSIANIVHYNTAQDSYQFTSQGLKEYIYSKIGNRKSAHLKIAENLIEKVPAFNKNELARHLEIAGEYEKSYHVIGEELEKADKVSALSYKKNLLQHLMEIPLGIESRRKVKTELSNCLFQIGELNASIILINELLDNTPSPEEELSMKILKGKALIGLQLLGEGKQMLESVLDKIFLEEKKNEVLAEIARTEYEMGNFAEAENKIDQLLDKTADSIEIQARIYNLKALIEFFKNNNPLKTLDHFSESRNLYQKIQSLPNVAAMENNIGNIYNFINEKGEAENHWNKAIQINESTGNLLYKAIILLNNGILYLESCDYEKAIEHYLMAQSIFTALGEKNNLGITFTNLGEAYMFICEYDKSVTVLLSAISIYNELGNELEKSEAILLLGKLYFTLGAAEKLEKLIRSFQRKLLKESDKLEFNYNYLLTLQKILINMSPEILNDLFSLRDKCKNYSDNYSFCDIQIKLIEELMKRKMYDNAFNELKDEDFLTIADENVYLDSYRTFLFGKLSELYKVDKLSPSIVYYENAFEKINKISITELTWKILFSLYQSYKERGNIKKMNEYKKFTLHTIEFILSQINSSKENYSLQKELVKVIGKLKEEKG